MGFRPREEREPFTLEVGGGERPTEIPLETVEMVKKTDRYRLRTGSRKTDVDIVYRSERGKERWGPVRWCYRGNMMSLSED